MEKKGTKIVIFSILIIGSIYICASLLRPNPTYIDTSLSAVDTFHTMPENSMEVIGYGSSRMWKGIDTIEMYENYGVGMYNYGGDGQKINTTQLYLLDSLRTQMPKVVLIEVKNVNGLLLDSKPELEILFTSEIPRFSAKTEYLSQVYGTELDRYVSYFVPIVSFQSNWKSLTHASFQKNANTYDFEKSMGYYDMGIARSIEPVDPEQFEELPIGEGGLEILDNIMEVCDEKNIDIIFYVAPWSGEYNYSEAMSAYATENGAVYFDMFDYMDELEISWETDFADENHLNDSGAKKLANFFGEYIVNHYDVIDMRTVENNLWEDNSAE